MVDIHSEKLYFPSSVIELLYKKYNQMEAAGMVGKLHQCGYSKRNVYLMPIYHTEIFGDILVCTIKRVNGTIKLIAVEVQQVGNELACVPTTREDLSRTSNKVFVPLGGALYRLERSFDPKQNPKEQEWDSLDETMVAFDKWMVDHLPADNPLRMAFEYRINSLNTLKATLETYGFTFRMGSDSGQPQQVICFRDGEKDRTCGVKRMNLQFRIIMDDGSEYEIWNNRFLHDTWVSAYSQYLDEHAKKGYCFITGKVLPQMDFSRKFLNHGKIFATSEKYFNFFDCACYGVTPMSEISTKEKKVAVFQSYRFSCSIEVAEKATLMAQYLLKTAIYKNYTGGKSGSLPAKYISVFPINGEPKSILPPYSAQEQAESEIVDEAVSLFDDTDWKSVAAKDEIDEKQKSYLQSLSARIRGYNKKQDLDGQWFYLETTQFSDNLFGFSAYGVWNGSSYEENLDKWFSTGIVPIILPKDAILGKVKKGKARSQIPKFYLGVPSISRLLSFDESDRVKNSVKEIIHNILFCGHNQLIQIVISPLIQEVEKELAKNGYVSYCCILFNAASMILKRYDGRMLFVNMDLYSHIIQTPGNLSGKEFGECIDQMEYDLNQTTLEMLSSPAMDDVKKKVSYVYGRLFALALSVERNYLRKNPKNTSDLAKYRNQMMTQPATCWENIKSNYLPRMMKTLHYAMSDRMERNMAQLVSLVGTDIFTVRQLDKESFILGEAAQTAFEMFCSQLSRKVDRSSQQAGEHIAANN